MRPSLWTAVDCQEQGDQPPPIINPDSRRQATPAPLRAVRQSVFPSQMMAITVLTAAFLGYESTRYTPIFISTGVSQDPGGVV